MKKSDIGKVLAEIGGRLCRAGVDRVCQLDSHTFIFMLYGIEEGEALLVSLKRNALRFHLLFERIHKEYVINTPSAGALNKYCSRAKILSVSFDGNLVEMHLFHGVEYKLLFHMDSRNVRLFEGNHEIFRLNKESQESRALVKEPLLSFDREKTFHSEADGMEGALTLNRSLSNAFIEQKNSVLRRKTLSALRGEQKKLHRLMDKLQEEQHEAKERERFRLMGELLKYNLSRVKKGDRSVTLTGFDGKATKLELDPTLGPRENMDRYFQQYGKLKRRAVFIEQKIAFEKARSAALEKLMDVVRCGNAVSITRSPLQFVESMDSDLLGRGFQDRVRRVFYPVKAQRREENKEQKFLRFYSKSGKTILVGRNARENDELTLRIARGNDLWFHVEVGSGSHVILRYDRQGEFQDADIVDAAMLALYFSKYRNEKSGDIVYTRRKFVRKPKNKPAGYVTYHNNKTKHIRVDEKVLGRLLDSRPQGLMLQQ
jgi:predicted ribosome quality control (RQC) complex YloA/Tae2 family protein